MKMKLNLFHNLVRTWKLNFIKFVFPGLSVIVISVILSESIQAQGGVAILKIKDPPAVCYPFTADLTNDAITYGSTEGFKFSYFIDQTLMVAVPDPAKVVEGTYYIKGTLIGSRTGWIAGSVKVTVVERPKLTIASPILKSPVENVDLTLPEITLGSDNGLSYSYWYDAEATKPLRFPKSAGKGNYYVKGTSIDGCFDIQSVIVNDK